MLIDKYLPRYQVTEIHEVRVDAPPTVTYSAIRETDLRDPVIEALFAVRELPNRIARRLRGEPPRPEPRGFTFGDLATMEMGWVRLGEEPGVEFVMGAVGRFWRRDYGWFPVEADRFIAFDEPGYAKLAVSFRVELLGDDQSLLRYEARTAATDKVARTRLRRYWRIIQPGVALVMRRALVRIRDEAERRGKALIGPAVRDA
jgi:hypothetical protein